MTSETTEITYTKDNEIIQTRALFHSLKTQDIKTKEILEKNLNRKVSDNVEELQC